MNNELSAIAEHAYRTAVLAGEAILPFYHGSENIQLEYKEDDSPLTAADKAAHEIIEQGLKQYLVFDRPAPILSEEGEDQSEVEKLSWKTYWCVDPLDGTQEFIRGRDEFTVNIALIEDHLPIVGVIYSPVNKEGYLAYKNGGAFQEIAGQLVPIKTRKPPKEPIRIIASRRHGTQSIQNIINSMNEYKMVHRGSALKFCEIARGGADLFLRTTETCEWDNAAGQCIVEEAGAKLFHFDFSPVRYNDSLSMKTKPLIVVGDPEFPWQEFLPKENT